MAWFAVRTRARRERTANRDLRRNGFETFFPRERIRRLRAHARSHTVEWVKRPLFPCWLFVEAAVEELHRVLAIASVAGIASCGDRPAPIPDTVMEALIDSADKSGIVSQKDLLAREIFRRNEPVRFKDDAPLARLHAIVVHDDGGERVRVLVEIFGGKRPMLVSAASLLKAA